MRTARGQRGERTPVIAAGACAIVALVTIGVIRGRDAAGSGPAKGTRLVYSMDLSGGGDRAAALSRAAAVVRDRVDERGAPVAVSVLDNGLAVEVGDVGDEALAGIEDVIARTAKLELVIVDDGAAAMARLVSEIVASDDARAQGVTADTDAWPAETGETHHDWYLRAADREEREADLSEAEARAIGCPRASDHCFVAGHFVIERVVDSITGGQIGAWLPPDRVLAYERVEATDGGRPYWRSYLLDRSRRLDGTAVADAAMTYDAQTGHPEVRIQLTPAGARAFAELTRANAGRKLAIVMDGRVKSAAVLQGAITGGELRVTMGGGKALDQERDATELVTVVRSGSLPAPLVLEAKHPFDHGGGGGIRGFLARAWLFFVGAAVLAVLVVGYLLSASRS